LAPAGRHQSTHHAFRHDEETTSPFSSESSPSLFAS